MEGQGLKVERVEFQERAGGHVLEHLSDGRAEPWAEILRWDPPTGFVLAWRPHSRPQPPTEVEVTFTSTGDGTTVVQLEHRGWERLTEDYRPVYESYAGGWIETLGRFAAAADADEPGEPSRATGSAGPPRRSRRGR